MMVWMVVKKSLIMTVELGRGRYVTGFYRSRIYPGDWRVLDVKLSI
jgi:hypothetical protein